MTVSLQVTQRGDGVRFGVRVKPRSSRSELLGVVAGVLSVALRAPPVAGEANAELIKLLARSLGVRRSQVTISSGAAGRRKIVAVTGMQRAALLRRLSEIL